LARAFFATARFAGALARARLAFDLAARRLAGLRAAAFARFAVLRPFAGFFALVPLLRLPRAIALLLIRGFVDDSTK